MQYFSNNVPAIAAQGSSEQCAVSTSAVEPRCQSTGNLTELESSSQRAAISKAYSDLLISGRHVGC